MNIHHRHTIHFCSACSCCPCCPTHCAETSSEPGKPGEPRRRSSILEALGSLARLAALISLLRATGDISGNPTGADQVPTEPIAPPTAAEPPSADAFLALFSQAAREHEHRVSTADDLRKPPATEATPPLSPIAAAFIAALRDEPNLA